MLKHTSDNICSPIYREPGADLILIALKTLNANLASFNLTLTFHIVKLNLDFRALRLLLMHSHSSNFTYGNFAFMLIPLAVL